MSNSKLKKAWLVLVLEIQDWLNSSLMICVKANSNSIMFELLTNFGPKHGKRVYKLEIQIEKLIKLEMIQAFGDIFKNTSPQHRWLFWKPSKYFTLPAGCLNHSFRRQYEQASPIVSVIQYHFSPQSVIRGAFISKYLLWD